MDISISELSAAIKKKKELHGIAEPVVLEAIRKYLRVHKISLVGRPFNDFKPLIKEVRAELHSLTGRFIEDSEKRRKMLANNSITELLATHRSTAERLSFYPQLKKIIASWNISSILDLGCGINPIALANKNITYYAADIREDECAIINSYFKKHNINGKAFICDLRDIKEPLPQADICILFKIFDVLEQRNHKLAEYILDIVPCPFVLVSFSTKTISGRPMNHPQRGWIEKLANRKGYSFTLIKSPNEIFYLIKKEHK